GRPDVPRADPRLRRPAGEQPRAARIRAARALGQSRDARRRDQRTHRTLSLVTDLARAVATHRSKVLKAHRVRNATQLVALGGAGETDEHMGAARAGRLSDVARRSSEYLAQNGETQTRRMRSELGITSKEGRATYGKAIDEVQRLMYVARVRAVGEFREDYNYTYDLFVRRYPETVKAAERSTSAEAAAALVARTLELAGAVTEKQLLRLFDWDDTIASRAI